MNELTEDIIFTLYLYIVINSMKYIFFLRKYLYVDIYMVAKKISENNERNEISKYHAQNKMT